MTARRLLIALLFLLAPALHSYAQIAAPSPPTLSAKGYLLIDFDSGRVLASQNADQKLDPASITKLMTAYAVFRAIGSGQVSLDDEVLVSEKAWKTTGSRMFIEVDTRVPVEQLLPGMIVQSGNDASVALAEHVAGTEQSFAEVMNQLAYELGMENTNYRNSTGLPDENHYTSATDIATLAAALIREYPDFYKWYSQKEFTYNGITQGNRNQLLWRDETVDGMKTGYTENAGYCLVSSAERNGMRLIAVVLGTSSPNARANESQALLNYGFRFFETHKMWDEGQEVASERVWRGASDAVQLVVDDPVYITIPRGSLDQLESEIVIPDQIVAPIQVGEALGEIRYSIASERIVEHELHAANGVEEGGFVANLWDEILLWFE